MEDVFVAGVEVEVGDSSVEGHIRERGKSICDDGD